jgi:hypothetical protein
MKIIDAITRKEPAIAIGVLLGAVTAAAQALADNPDVTTWVAALPLVAAAVVRFVVVSPATADQRAGDAFLSGIAQGKERAAKKAAKKPATKTKAK